MKLVIFLLIMSLSMFVIGAITLDKYIDGWPVVCPSEFGHSIQYSDTKYCK